MPDHTVDHSDSLFCAAVIVCFVVLFCHSEILKLWQAAAFGGGKSLYVCMLQRFGSGEEEGVEREKTMKSSFSPSLVCLPTKTQRNVSVRHRSAKSSI